MPKISFLISQFVQSKKELHYLVEALAFAASEKGPEWEQFFPGHVVTLNRIQTCKSFLPAALLLGTKSWEFIWRKWVEDLLKEECTKVAALFEC